MSIVAADADQPLRPIAFPDTAKADSRSAFLVDVQDNNFSASSTGTAAAAPLKVAIAVEMQVRGELERWLEKETSLSKDMENRHRELAQKNWRRAAEVRAEEVEV